MAKRIILSIGAVVLAFLATMSAQAQTYSNAVMALNPVAYWPLGETTLPSSTGLYIATNSGTLGAAGNGYYETWWQTNDASGVLTNMNSIVHIGGALPADTDTAMQQGAIGQYVVIPRVTNGVANPAVTVTAPFTIEAWIYPTNGASGLLKPIIAEGFNPSISTNLNYATLNQGVALGFYSANLYFVTYNGAGTKSEIDANNVVLNKWHHFVATFDGTVKKLYLDGVLIGSQTPPADQFGQRYAADPVSPLIVGGGNELGLSGGANVLFGGGIDEVAVYNTALSSTQVTNHWTTGTNTTPATPYAQVVHSDNPSIYLRLDEPAFVGPVATASPVANNSGSLGAAANGYYLPGTTPGVAGPTNSGFGATSLAVALNGFNSGVDVGGGALPSLLNPTNNQPMTVMAWFKGNPADCVGRFQTIIGHSDASWRLNLDNNGGNRFNPGNGPELQFASLSDEVTSGMYLNDGNWHFIAGVSDGTNESMYLDGVLVKTASGVGTVTNGTLQDVILGGDPQYLAPQPTPVAGGGRWFDGSLAHVAFFTNALSSAQIQGVYGAAGVAPSIRVQPASQALDVGTTASIATTVVGSSPVTYQWYQGTTAVTGQTTSSLTFSPVTSGSAGTYYLVATNNYGAVTSSVVTVSVFQPGTYSYAVRQLNPVAYWPLNETTQPPAGQYIATNSGTLGAAANGFYQSWYQPITFGMTNTFYATNNIQHTAGATGDGDTALACGNVLGAGQYVVLPRFTNGVANPATTITAPFTIEAWVKTTNLTSGVRPIVNEGRNLIQSDSTHNYTNNMYGFSLGEYQGKFYFQVYDGLHGDNNNQNEIDITGLQSNVWYHIAVTFDGSSETFYSNGVPIQTKTGTYAVDPVSPLLIGTGTELSAGNGGNEFSGAIDDVAIYNTVLSQAQIQAHYNAVGASYAATVTADSPSIYLRLDEPAFNNYPSPSTYPVAANYGTLGAAANGAYQPGTTPGVPGPSYPGFGSSTAVAINGFYGAVDIGGGVTPLPLNPIGKPAQSVAAWFQANPADARFQEIVSRGDASWRVALNMGGLSNPDDNHYNPGNGPELGFTNFTDINNNQFRVNDGAWHFVVGSCDGNNVSMYIDGALAKTASGAGSIAGSGLDALIGGSPGHVTPAYNSSNIRYFDGQIAQVAYFTNALTLAQVQQMYGAAGVPLSLINEPTDSQFNVGTSASLTVGVRGSFPIYQWYSTNVNTGTVTLLSGQTNASLVFNPAGLNNSGFYFAIATNSFNAVTSSVAQLTIVGPPVITQSSPTDLRVFVGTTPTLQLATVGPSPIYAWSSNNVAIPGATNTSYTLTTADTSSVGTNIYRCVITNNFGAATDTVSVAVLADPTAPFPAHVLADHPINYFRLDEADTGYPNDGVTAYDYAGGYNGSYSNATLGASGYNLATDPTETAAMFNQATLSDSYAGNTPSYLNFATNGGNAEFSVEAWAKANSGQIFDAGIVTIGYGFGGEEFCLDCGGANHAVRFYINGANGVNYKAESTFVLSNHPENSGWHHIVAVCDEAGGHIYLYIDGVLQASTTVPAGVGIRTQTSPLAIGSRLSTSSATDYDNAFIGLVNDVALYNYPLSAAQVQSHYLNTGIAPLITSLSPSDVTTNQNSTVQFTITVSGTAPFFYQWFDPSMTPIAGQTNATLTLTNVQISQGGSYQVNVTNLYGGPAITNANLSVNQGPPVITADITPLDQTVFAGASVTYSVQVSGTPPFAYQWYQDGSLVAGATNESYTFAALLGTNTYYCSITNAQSGGSPTVSSTGTVVGMPGAASLDPANYTDKLKITFSGYNRGETLHDFPVLVRLSTNISGFNYSHFASGTGGDLRFTDAGGTFVIPHEIDEWNNANGESFIWVQVPALSGTNDFIWAYWGNPAAGAPLPSTNVWVPQPWEGLPAYDLVYHLKESGFPYADSTAQFPALTGNAPAQGAGQIGLGETFASGSFLDSGTINLSNAWTVSAWINVSPTASNIQTVWANKTGGAQQFGFALCVNSYQTANGEVVLESGNGTAGAQANTGTGAISFGQWHLLTTTMDPVAGKAHIYVDGVDMTTATSFKTDVATNNDVHLGNFLDGAFPFNGAIDEARIRQGTNSANWIAASYMTVAQNASFENYGTVNTKVINPPTVQFSTSGNNLVLTGSGGPTNGEYRVLSTTNLLVPLSQWTPVLTNFFDASGDFSNGIPLDATKRGQYFRMAIP